MVRKPLRRLRKFLSVKQRLSKSLASLWESARGLSRIEYIRRRPLLTALYFYLQGSYYFEQKTILAGQLHHYRSLVSKEEAPIYLLRRNIHRIEKGLSSPNRRPVFAKAYINETVDAYASLLTNGRRFQDARPVDSTLQWSTCVLSDYFQAVEDTDEIKRARQKFQSVCDDTLLVRAGLHAQAHPPENRVPYSSLLHLASNRHSIRRYQAKPVPRQLIDQAVEVARYAPSACNRQAYEFVVVDDPHSIQQLITIPGGADEFGQNVPCLVILIGKQSAYPYDRDRHVTYIDASLAAMSFVLALESLGLASCCINWPDVYEKGEQLAKKLQLAEDERGILFISVGYQLEGAVFPTSEKRTVDELRSYRVVR